MLRLTCVLLLCLVANTQGQIESYVVGGSFVDIKHHAHSASLNINCVTKGVKTGWICGASVVNQRILLTAAHCLYECAVQSHITTNLGDRNKERGLRYTTTSFVTHENYNADSCSNDLGLVKTTKAFPLGPLISRVALMRKPPYTEMATIAGWGMTDEDRMTATNFLKSVPQKVWSRDKCLNVFGLMPRGTFCAASPDRIDEYPSQGDSGCGLLVRGYIELGLVSYKSLAVSRNVIVYTDTGYFYDWIMSNAKRLFCFQR